MLQRAVTTAVSYDAPQLLLLNVTAMPMDTHSTSQPTLSFVPARCSHTPLLVQADTKVSYCGKFLPHSTPQLTEAVFTIPRQEVWSGLPGGPLEYNLAHIAL